MKYPKTKTKEDYAAEWNERLTRTLQLPWYVTGRVTHEDLKDKVIDFKKGQHVSIPADNSWINPDFYVEDMIAYLMVFSKLKDPGNVQKLNVYGWICDHPCAVITLYFPPGGITCSTFLYTEPYKHEHFAGASFSIVNRENEHCLLEHLLKNGCKFEIGAIFRGYREVTTGDEYIRVRR